MGSGLQRGPAKDAANGLGAHRRAMGSDGKVSEAKKGRDQPQRVCIERSPSGMGGASATAWLAFKGGAGGQGMRPRSLVVRQRKFVGMA